MHFRVSLVLFLCPPFIASILKLFLFVGKYPKTEKIKTAFALKHSLNVKKPRVICCLLPCITHAGSMGLIQMY